LDLADKAAAPLETEPGVYVVLDQIDAEEIEDVVAVRAGNEQMLSISTLSTGEIVLGEIGSGEEPVRRSRIRSSVARLSICILSLKFFLNFTKQVGSSFAAVM
jgi:hypothetical protein